MKKFTRILAIVLALVLTAVLSVSLTLAYLTDKDEKVNVMTLGNVNIEQHEYERVTDANGNWIPTGETDKYGYTPDKLQVFTQAKPLYPAVFADGNIKWDDRNGSQNASGEGSHQQSWAQVGASGSCQLFDDSVKNAQDKFVFVENTGKSDAYVRTWVALEQGALEADHFPNIIMTNLNGNQWSWEVADTNVVIGDSVYYVLCATYLGPKSNPTGILAPNTVSYPSLLQVYMRPEATNEDCANVDGNGNGTYDILVFSQAVQTEGFDNAQAALTAGFGTNHPWTTNAPEIPVTVSNGEDLVAALASGKSVVLAKDVAIPTNETIVITSGQNATLDLNGHTLSANNTNIATHNFAIDVKGGELTITNGTVTMEHTGANMGWNGATTVIDITAGGVLNLENAQIINEGGTDMNFAVHLNNWGDATLNADNCVFGSSYCGVRVFNSGPNMNNVKITNSTIKGNTRAFWVHNYSSTDFGGKLYSGSSAAYDQASVDARLNLDIFNNNNTFVLAETAKSPIRYGFDSASAVYYDASGNLVP